LLHHLARIWVRPPALSEIIFSRITLGRLLRCRSFSPDPPPPSSPILGSAVPVAAAGAGARWPSSVAAFLFLVGVLLLLVPPTSISIVLQQEICGLFVRGIRFGVDCGEGDESRTGLGGDVEPLLRRECKEEGRNCRSINSKLSYVNNNWLDASGDRQVRHWKLSGRCDICEQIRTMHSASTPWRYARGTFTEKSIASSTAPFFSINFIFHVNRWFSISSRSLRCIERSCIVHKNWSGVGGIICIYLCMYSFIYYC